MTNILYTNREEAALRAELEQFVNTHRYLDRILSADKNIAKYKQLIDFINFKVPQLTDSEYTFTTKIYWILHNLADFPKCKHCGKTIGEHINVRLSGGYFQYCSVKCSSNSTEKQQAIRQTCIKKYGVESPQQTVNVRNKLMSTVQKKYGYKHALLHPRIRKKIKATMINRYGVEHISQTPEFAKYHHKRIKYDNLTFDSSWEVSVYKYCKAHNLQCEYQPLIVFKYTFNNKLRYYHPDFLIEGRLYEVKGDHFFKEDGTMQNPFNHKLDALYEAKHQCMINNNVKIIRYADLQNLQAVIIRSNNS